MSITVRTGPVVVEVDDSAAALRVIDYACRVRTAAAKCPVAIVPHEPTTADRERETNDLVAPSS